MTMTKKASFVFTACIALTALCTWALARYGFNWLSLGGLIVGASGMAFTASLIMLYVDED